MTTFTAALNFIVIDQRADGSPGYGYMTGRAVVTGENVTCAFANACRRTVVAAFATAGHFGVIDPGINRCPRGADMAGFTNIGCCNVRQAFAGGIGAIVTGAAGAIHFVVIDGQQWQPATTPEMTGVAVVAGIDMRGKLAGGDCAIVTGDTGANHFVVIHGRIYYWRPDAHPMAGLAQVCRRNVSCRLVAGDGAVVATRAGSGADGAVIKAVHKPVGR